MSNTADIDEPVTLEDACGMFPRAKLTVSTLRAEAGRGRLEIFRLGRRDYTTASAMREMIRRCRDDARLQGSTSMPAGANGSSATDHASSARAALRATVTALKAGLPRISASNTRRSAAQRH